MSSADSSHVIDIDVSQEMETSFLEYAYSVIYARALPDARDGLKPVQRRILFQMDRMSLWPDKGHVKSSRVVGDVMGRLHPHGDIAIYDALVRLAQPFTMRLPLVDGHGNFGSLDDGPAAPRYTEARLALAATIMTADLDEDVVDMVPNYDNQLLQPSVLPAAYPNLLVNGASGIAVGMATNIPPHNLGEVTAAAVHLLENPQASVEELMEFCPGPDLPGGGVIVGLEGIREAYATGRGSFSTRATAKVEQISPRKQGIVITELPYLVGPERVAEKLKDAVNQGKVKGVSGWHDLSDRNHGMRLIVEVKNGFNPEAVLAQLYKSTPLEDSFAINAVALVQGQPQTLGLKQALEVFLDHRLTVTRRRSEYRLRKKQERLHLVEGLLLAVLNIDEVIQVIRAADDSEVARQRLMQIFDLSSPQAEYILELRLRRLTKFSRLELENERGELADEIAALEEILASDWRLREVVRDELLEVSARLSTPRRTILVDSEGCVVTARGGQGAKAAPAAAALKTVVKAQVGAAVPLEVPDEPCLLVLGAQGQIVRLPGDEALPREGARGPHDALASTLATRNRAQYGLITTAGNLLKLEAVAIPQVPRPAEDAALDLSSGVEARGLGDFAPDEQPLALVPIDPQGPPLGLITAQGTIKRVRPEYPAKGNKWEIITLEEGDYLVAAGLAPDNVQFVAVSADAQLLRTPGDKVRPQGRAATGVAGMAVRSDAKVIAGCLLSEDLVSSAVVVTVAQASGTLAGQVQTSVKVSPLDRYPMKGRGAQGVRAQRFLRGEESLALAWVGLGPAKALDENGQPLPLPEVDERRDGSGKSLGEQISLIG